MLRDRVRADSVVPRMITRPTVPRHARVCAPPTGGWRRILADGVGSVAELLARLELTPAEVGWGSDSQAAARQFPLRVPKGFVARMKPGDPRDPLLLQVLPVAAETAEVPGFVADPLAERSTSPAAGLLHKYRGRVLVVATGACAVHCRYCFRRHFPYGEHALTREARERVVAAVAADPTVTEVILSGGDPLTLTDDKLGALAEELAAIPHVTRLRVHSRLPVVLPERVDDGLLTWLTGTRLAPVMVLHANHPAEIDGNVAAAAGRLRAAGVHLLNQAVLLAGVNDAAETLVELSERLFEAGVLPYYLHLLDPVAGAAHFDVPEARGRQLLRQVASRLPGYLVPRLVREVPAAPAKVPVDLALGEGLS